MKPAGTLVDTSVWIDFFRGVASVKELLTKLLARDRVFTAGPVLFELLQGIKSSEEREQVKEALLSVHFLEITPEDWEGAALIARDLRLNGITIPMTDLLLAQLAKNHDLEIISSDPHFDQIPGITRRKPSQSVPSHGPHASSPMGVKGTYLLKFPYAHLALPIHVLPEKQPCYTTFSNLTIAPYPRSRKAISARRSRFSLRFHAN